MPDVTAVLVNYNAGDELRQALRSIADAAGGLTWEAYVVDNASTDGSDAIPLEFAPAARVVRNARNVGFGAGVNQGLALATAPLVLIMNPDCRLTPGALGVLRAALAADDTCAIVGPKILDPDGTVQGSARGDPDMLTGVFGRRTWLRRALPWLPVSRRNVVDADALASGADRVSVDWLSGACMLARREALCGVSGFDEAYFLYWEDADLCRRLRGRGYHVAYVPAAVAVHRVGHSSEKARPLATRAFHDSAWRYYATYVAPAPLDPRRLLAWALLKLRCWWLLVRA